MFTLETYVPCSIHDMNRGGFGVLFLFLFFSDFSALHLPPSLRWELVSWNEQQVLSEMIYNTRVKIPLTLSKAVMETLRSPPKYRKWIKSNHPPSFLPQMNLEITTMVDRVYSLTSPKEILLAIEVEKANWLVYSFVSLTLLSLYIFSFFFPPDKIVNTLH